MTKLPELKQQEIDPASYTQRKLTLEALEIEKDLINKLGASGFFYDEVSKKLSCFACNLKIDLESLGDNPDEEHMKRETGCSFIQQPLSERTKPYWQQAKYLDFSTTDSRKSSFDNWPINVVNAEELSKAGFFYFGKSDRTCCYHCGSIFRSWVSEDDPLTEHAKGQPECEFLLLVKGISFVENIIKDVLNNINSEISAIQPATKDESDLEKEEDEEDEEGPAETPDEVDACKICLARYQQIVFVPCGHSSCGKCAFKVNDCPHCRGEIVKRIKPLIQETICF